MSNTVIGLLSKCKASYLKSKVELCSKIAVSCDYTWKKNSNDMLVSFIVKVTVHVIFRK